MSVEIIQTRLQRENLSLAPLSKRSWAFFIDELIIAVLFTIAYWNAFVSAQSLEQTIALTNQLVFQIAILKVIYQSFFVWMYGATVGKMVLRIRVISIDVLDSPSLFPSILRATVRVFSEWIFYLGFVWAFVEPLRQTWQDKPARTLVINA